jgi:hypothetical protein
LSLYEHGTLEDVRIRLSVIANAVASEVSGAEPGNLVWSALQTRIHEQRETLDQHAVFKRDPMLLLGELCEMSDLCMFDWGLRRA